VLELVRLLPHVLPRWREAPAATVAGLRELADALEQAGPTATSAPASPAPAASEEEEPTASSSPPKPKRKKAAARKKVTADPGVRRLAKRALELGGPSAEAAGRAVGVSGQSLTRWAAGQATPKAASLERLRAAVGRLDEEAGRAHPPGPTAS